MTYSELLDQVIDAEDRGELKPLTIFIYPELVGKRIQTIYYGYKGQCGVDDFIVGNLISKWDYAAAQWVGDPTKAPWKSQQEYWKSYMTKKQKTLCKEHMKLLAADGRDTYIFFRRNYADKKHFFCSDLDRIVFYRVVE